MSAPEIKPVAADYEDVSVRGFLHIPVSLSGDGLVLTHGAGANCESALLVTLAKAFAAVGVMVLRCDLPFRQLLPHGPPPRGSAERDQHGLQAAVSVLREHVPRCMFLGGHSYGGRQASMLATSNAAVADALLLLSYPLHPPKRHDQLRTLHFPSLQTPALFVSGTRDGFGTVEELSTALKMIPTRTELLAVQGAGHELLTGKNREELPSHVVQSFLSFCQRAK